jgi:Cd2+/Zn2+-exporting ATPase
MNYPDMLDVRELAGKGVVTKLDGQEVAVGNASLMRTAGVTELHSSSCPTVVHVARSGQYLGHLGLSDQLRPDARGAVDAIRCLGVKKVFMLTGDRTEAAHAVSASLGLDGFRAELMPEDKVSAMAELAGKKTIFVGDGINDAPVIAGATVGVAMGGIGSDAAVEAADVVLVEPRPGRLAVAIALARNTRNIAGQNIALSLGVKALFLLLGAMGMASVWGAVFADVGVALLAVLNSLRAMRISAGERLHGCLAPAIEHSGDD